MTLFVDTNTLLHYQPVDQINWKEVVPGEELTLAYSFVVIDELDKHKQNPKLSSRAKLVQSQLMQFRKTGQLTEEVKMITVPKPHSRVLTDMDLDLTQTDMWVLASIIEYGKAHANEQVAILTSDVGMQLRAEMMNIQVVRLDEKYAITGESDDQKELKKAKQELAALKNAIPKLDIKLSSKEADGYQLSLPDFPRYVESQMRNLKAKHPNASEMDTPSWYIGSRHTKADAVTYNHQLDDYFGFYQKYLQAREELYQAEMLTVELMAFLGNVGSVPGRGMHIEFRFPDLVSVHHEAPMDRLGEPNMPYPPTLGFLKPISFSHERQSYYHRQSDRAPIPQIVTLNSGITKVEISVDSIKQESVEALNVLYATFKDVDNIKGFNIDYAIRSDNVPKVVRGQLNVKIKLV